MNDTTDTTGTTDGELTDGAEAVLESERTGRALSMLFTMLAIAYAFAFIAGPGVGVVIFSTGALVAALIALFL